MAQELKAALSEFVGFAQTLRGDEKSEAQPFLDHFLPREKRADFITDDCIQPLLA